VDDAYPRAIIEDQFTFIAQAIGYIDSVIGQPRESFCFQQMQPSEFLRPWRYPAANNAGQQNGSEGVLSHPGPWVQGQSAEVLMNTSPGDPSARTDFEKAQSAEDCERLSTKHFPLGQHLGDPVDYSIYLMGRLTNTAPGASIPPDFNLDSDRGYGYHCWDWNRGAITDEPDACAAVDPTVSFNYNEPCTVPEGYCNPSQKDVGPHYSPSNPLELHFEGQTDPQCVQFEERPK
jgi:hypothetical protein